MSAFCDTATVGGPRVRRRGSCVRVAFLAFIWLTGPTSLAAPSDSDLAARLAADGAGAADRGKQSDAARLFLRAHRWDPTRLAERRRGVGLLARRDPDAALRHARLALADDALFGADDPALLQRLQAAAVERSNWRLAANLAARRLEIVSRLPRVSLSRRAGLLLEAGRHAWMVGDARTGSDVFAKAQALTLRSEDDDADTPGWPSALEKPVTWEAIAGCHLAADQPVRAKLAVDRLARFDGVLPSVECLRARLALAREDPLAALEHVERAIEAAHQSIADEGAAPYQLMVDALRATNQSARAIEELRRFHAQRPEDSGLVITLIDALAAAGRGEEAFAESGKLIESLLESLEPYDPLKSEAPSDDPNGARRSELARAASQWLRLAREHRRTEVIWRTMPQLADRLGSLTLVGDAIVETFADPVLRQLAVTWLAKAHAKSDPPPGLRRSALAVATACGKPDLAERLVRSRVEKSLAEETSRPAAVRELVAFLDALLEAQRDEAATRATEWAIGLIDHDESLKRGIQPDDLAILHAQRAESLLRHSDVGQPPAAPVLRHIDLARSLDPDEIGHAWLAVRAYEQLGDEAAALDAAETALERFDRRQVWTSNLATQEVLKSIRLAAARLSLQADDEVDAVEHDERALDRWPDEPTALAALAMCWARNGDHLERAQRMAERATLVGADLARSWHALGVTLGQTGDKAGAEKALRRALDLSPSDSPTIRSDYAAALRALGRAEEADSLAP